MTLLVSPARPGKILFLKDRCRHMLKKEFLTHHPIHNAGFTSEDLLPPPGFGAVLARAGVGKTAFLVQVALHAMLNDFDVLHVSLHDPVNKIDLWYRELFINMARQSKMSRVDDMWQEIMPHRFIMTFKIDGFTVPKLEERLTDLTVQDIFHPKMIIMDGLHFDPSVREKLEALKGLAARFSVALWFTAHIHRHDGVTGGGIPVSLGPVSDLFDTLILLQPDGERIPVRMVKGPPGKMPSGRLFLDPSTLLIEKADTAEMT